MKQEREGGREGTRGGREGVLLSSIVIEPPGRCFLC